MLFVDTNAKYQLNLKTGARQSHNKWGPQLHLRHWNTQEWVWPQDYTKKTKLMRIYKANIVVCCKCCLVESTQGRGSTWKWLQTKNEMYIISKAVIASASLLNKYTEHQRHKDWLQAKWQTLTQTRSYKRRATKWEMRDMCNILYNWKYYTGYITPSLCAIIM
mgnify:CR=1 FL=1